MEGGANQRCDWWREEGREIQRAKKKKKKKQKEEVVLLLIFRL